MISSVQRLPSGLVVEMLPWTVGDMMRMARSSAKARHLVVSELLAKTRIVENPYGLYGLEVGSKLEEPSVLMVGDRIALSIALRIFSLDESEFTFEWKCEECGHKNAWTVDLRRFLLPALPNTEEADRFDVKGDVVNGQRVALFEALGAKPILLGYGGSEDRLYFKGWSDEQAQKYAAGEHEIFVCEDGAKIHWTHMTDKMVRLIQSKGINPEKEPDKLMRESTLLQIVKIEDAQGTEIQKRGWDAWLEESFLWRDSIRFNKERDELGCGIDTELDVVCANKESGPNKDQECGHTQWIELPTIEDAGFFSPSRGKDRSRKRLLR